MWRVKRVTWVTERGQSEKSNEDEMMKPKIKDMISIGIMKLVICKSFSKLVSMIGTHALWCLLIYVRPVKRSVMKNNFIIKQHMTKMSL